MKRILLYVSLCLLTSCVQSPVVPTTPPTATLTQTPALVPTNTATVTPTLELWLQLIPEGVVTVDKSGDNILGLDADGNQVMMFNLERGEWVDVPEVSAENSNSLTYKNEAGEDVTEEFGIHSFTNKNGETIELIQLSSPRAYMKYLADKSRWYSAGTDQGSVLKEFAYNTELAGYLKQFDIADIWTYTERWWGGTYPSNFNTISSIYNALVAEWDGGTLVVGQSEDGSFFDMYYDGDAETFMGLINNYTFDDVTSPNADYANELASQH